MGFAQTPTSSTAKWQEIERLISIKNYEQILPLLANIKVEARRTDNSAEWVRAFMAESQTKKINATDDDAFIEIDKHFQQHIKQASLVEKAVLNNFYALFLASNLNRYLSESDNPFIAVSEKQKRDYIDSVFNRSLEPKEFLINEPLEKWSAMLTDRQNVVLSPTLYHFLAYQYLAYLQQTEGEKSIATSRLWGDLLSINKSKGYGDATAYLLALPKSTMYRHDPARITAYKDIIAQQKSDYNAYLLFQIADSYHHEDDNIEALKYANQALEQYPNSPWIDHVQNLLKLIKEAKIQLLTKQFAPAKQYTPLRVTTVNVDSLFIRVYNTSSRPKDYRIFELEYDSLTFETKLDAKLVYEESMLLKPFADQKQHTTLYKINPLPFGSYTILVSNNQAFKDDGLYKEVVQQEITISDVFVSANEDPKVDKDHIFKALLINRTSGAPYANKRVDLYESSTYKKLVPVRKMKTDQQGELEHKSETGASIREFMLYLADEDQLIDLSKLGTVERHVFSKKKEEQDDLIAIETMTDRAIYRPGQQVYFKSILYNSHALLGRVMEKEELWVYLRDANWQTIDSIALTSTAYGSVNGSFMLPTNTLTGAFQILTKHKGKTTESRYFKVEAYKRPTFKVILDRNKATYTLRDTATFTGRVETLSGAASPNQTVRYTVSFYHNQRHLTINHMDSGTTTDQQGCFAFKVPLTDTIFADLEYFSLAYRAEVMSHSGEMQADDDRYDYSNRPWHMYIEAEGAKEEKRWKEITIRTSNTNGEQLPMAGKINIYKLAEPKKALTDESSSDFTDLDYSLLSVPLYEQYFPHIFDPTLLSASMEKTLVASYDFDTRDTSLVRIDSSLFSKGRYSIEAISAQQSDSIRAYHYMQLYDPLTKKVNDNQFLSLSFDKRNYRIGDKVMLTYQTDEPDAKYLYLHTAIGTEKKPRQVLPIKNGKATYTFTLGQEHISPNISFSALLVVNNKSEIIHSAVPVAKEDKKLKITAKTFRDKIRPGQKEKWSFSIAQKDLPVSESEVLASMYDSALDMFASSSFPSSLYTRSPYYGQIHYFYIAHEFYKNTYARPVFYKDNRVSTTSNELSTPYSYDLFDTKPWKFYVEGEGTLDEVVVQSASAMLQGKVSGLITGTERGFPEVDDDEMYDRLEAPDLQVEIENRRAQDAASPDGINSLLSQVQARSNLQETAFFFPTLYTGADGKITFEFDSPEALTKWKLQLFAHGKDLSAGTASFFSQTQKQLMVRPNLPRYFREGDEIVLKAQVQNISEEQLTGNARIEMIDPASGEDISSLFAIAKQTKPFAVATMDNSLVDWRLKVPANLHTVQIKIIAATDEFSDGEIIEIPILPNKVLITDSERIILKDGESRSYSMQSANKDNLHAKVQVQSNPILEIIAALDYLQSAAYENTEQLGSKWFGLKMMQYIGKHYPDVASYFEALNQSDHKGKLEENSSLSELEHEEMPWLRDIKAEKTRLTAVAALFNKNNLLAEIKQVEHKLLKHQDQKGLFSWFADGKADPVMSIRLLEMTGKVLHLDQSLIDQQMILAMSRLTSQLEQDSSIFHAESSVGLGLDYLYARQYWSNYFKAKPKAAQLLTSKLLKSSEVTAKGAAGIATKAWIVNRLYGDAKQSNELQNRINQEVIHDKDRGMYWPSNDRSYNATSMQSYMLEAYKINDPSKLPAITQWIYYKKQANHWRSTWMTVDAIYALLLVNDPNDFSLENKVNIRVDQVEADTKDVVLGQLSLDFDRSTLEQNKQLTIQNNNSRTIYGGIYHQYFLPLAEVKSNSNAIAIEKHYLVERAGKWVLSKEAKLGERIKVKITVVNDSPLHYVHLKDSRPSGVEPIFQPSGYNWLRGGYYFTMKDASTNYFFDNLGKGKREFEYEVKANNIGVFNSGISTIECLYNPSVLARSENIQLVIVP